MRLLLVNSWADLLTKFLSNPLDFLQDHWYGLILLLLLLFALSRLNNYMEVNSVNRAINLARAFVGSVMAFIIAPITVLILINAIAYIKGIPTFSFWFIWDWLKLTASTFWWMVRSATCFSCDNDLADYAYDINSLIRIAWVVIPVTFIWLRSTSTLITRFMLLPFIALIFYITYQRKASPTFFDKYIPEKYRDYKVDDILNFNKDNVKRFKDIVNVDRFRDDEPTTDADRIPTVPKTNPQPKTKPRTRNIKPQDTQRQRTVKPKKPATNDALDNLKDSAEAFKVKNTRNIIYVLIGLLLLAALLHFTGKFRWLALAFMIISIGGFLFMSPSLFSRPPPPTYVDSTDMLQRFERMHKAQKGRPSVSLTELSVRITKQLHKEKRTTIPDRYCQKYKAYFYDFCVDRANYD